MIKYRLKEAEAGAEKVLPLGLVGGNQRGETLEMCFLCMLVASSW